MKKTESTKYKDSVHVNVLTLFISKAPKIKETSGQIRRTNSKCRFSHQTCQRPLCFVFLLQIY